MPSASSIFRPFRGLGIFSSDVPFAVKYKPHSKEYNIAVPVGERFNVYKLPNLKLLGISDCLPCDINAFTSDKNFVYAAAGNTIYAFRGLRHVIFKLEGHVAPIRLIQTFSECYLVSYDESGLLLVWNLKSKDIVSRESFTTDTFNVSALCHPSGYGDKILLGSTQGPLQLWKSMSCKRLYWFKGFDSPVSCLVQAPAVDVCAIGLNNGQIVLHNLRYDVSLVSVAQDGGAITAVAFRSSTAGLTPIEALQSAGISGVSDPKADIYLIAGSAAGHLSTWQFDNGDDNDEVGACRATNYTEDLHLARVTSMFCIPSGEAAGALVTNGADNCVKVSYFDRPDGGPRTGHTRSGHFLPPQKIAFWTGGSAGGNLLVSAGSDAQLRIFSTYNERYDKNLGRAYAPGLPGTKKLNSVERSRWLLPGASALALSPGRAHDWDSLAVAHANRREVTTWNFLKATRGKHWLDPSKFRGRGGEALRVHKSTIATSLCMTRCGHFVVIGYSSGDIFKFNVQSGLEYGSFGEDVAHNSAIVGVHVTSVNRLLISVGETEVKFWDFSSRKLIDDTLTLISTSRFSKFHDDSDALAVALSTGQVLLVNVLTRRIFRRFPNPDCHPCVDLAFTSDGTILVTAHRGDALIKTWDVVDCRLIDCFRVIHPVTSLAFSPADDLLATTHSSCLGVYLWDNRATYEKLHLRPLPIDYVPPLQESSFAPIPTVSLSAPRDFDEEEMELEEDEAVGSDQKTIEAAVYLSPDQLQDRMLTLSGLPASYFSTLLQLDSIKRRNAATMMVSDQVSAKLPFFLPVVETTTGMCWIDEDNQEGETAQDAVDTMTTTRRKRKRCGGGGGREVGLDEILLGGIEGSVLGCVLGSVDDMGLLNDNTCDELMSRLLKLNPTALDAELRSLAPPRDDLVEAISAVTSVEATSVNPYARLSTFLTLLLNRFRRNLDVDFSTACLEGILRYHGELIVRPLGIPSSASNEPILEDFGAADAEFHGECVGDFDVNRPSALIRAVLAAKSDAHVTLSSQITRSIALIDFMRNATSTLQM